MCDHDDPSAVGTIVVTAADVVAALEASYRTATEETVLRVTPPFSARMRARIHVDRGVSDPEPTPILLPPERFVDADCPEPPKPDEVEDVIRADPVETYTIEGHRDRYRETLERWRETVLDHVNDEVPVPATERNVTVGILGTLRDERDS